MKSSLRESSKTQMALAAANALRRERLLSHRTYMILIVLASLALAAVFEELATALEFNIRLLEHNKSDEISYLMPFGKMILHILSLICEAAGAAIIIYYLVDLRIAKIRQEFEEFAGSFRDVNILSAVFQANVERSLVEVWRSYVQAQLFTVNQATFRLIITEVGSGFEARVVIEVIGRALDKFSVERPVPHGSSPWTFVSLQGRVADKVPFTIRADSEQKTYKLSADEGDRLVITSEFCRLYVAKTEISDNHVLYDGASKLNIVIDIDERLGNDREFMSIPIVEVPKLKTLEGDHATSETIIGSKWKQEKNKSENGSKVEYNSYSYQPNFCFLPFQGFSYKIGWESREK